MLPFMQQAFQVWLGKRMPPSTRVTLNQRCIFIFPSRYGCLYVVLCMSIFIGATNYENNMLYALVFWLLGLFLVAILHSFANLSGLTIAAIKVHPAFAGAHAEFELELSTAKRRGHEDVRLRWPGQEAVLTQVSAKSPTHVIIAYLSERRGWLRPGRLLIESVYPLGLLRVWTWVDLDVQALIYPRPIPTRVRPTSMSLNDCGHERALGHDEEFHGFRNYQAGDPLRHVMWRSLARGQSLQSRLHQDDIDLRQWVDWQSFEGMDREQRLARMCWLTLALTRAGGVYGLHLPGLTLAPDRGEGHRDRVLKALALFDVNDTPSDAPTRRS
jgi:uncharacterized protein (DUF58 family)